MTDEKVDICYDSIKMVGENGSYILELTDFFADNHYSIKFDNISVLLKAYRAESDYLFWLFIKTPWDYVAALANRINAHFCYGVENQNEKKIFGLIKHLTGERFIDIDTGAACGGSPMLLRFDDLKEFYAE